MGHRYVVFDIIYELIKIETILDEGWEIILFLYY